MRQSQRQTTDFILKAEKQKGVAYRELLANLYQHLLEKCLTTGAADMNRPNYCPVNSSTQVAGQFPSQAYLFFLHNPNFQPTCRLLKSAFSNQHFTPCSSQISMTNQQFRISVLPSPNQQVRRSADQRFTPALNRHVAGVLFLNSVHHVASPVY